MTNRNVLMLLLSMGMVFTLFSSAAAASDWPSFQGSNDNNGVTSDAITTTFDDNWTFTDAGAGWTGFDSAPVIGNGRAYYVYSNGSVFCFTLNNSDPVVPVWQNNDIGGNVSSFEISTPAYDSEHDRLFVGLSYGNTTVATSICALNGSTGAVVWSNTTLIPAEYQINSPIKYDRNMNAIYFGTANMTNLGNYTYIAQEGSFHCLNASTGIEIWNNTTGYGYYYAAPAIDEGLVMIGDDEGILRSFSKSDGTVKDTINVSAEVGVPLQIRSAVVYDHGPGQNDDINSILYCTATRSPSGAEAYLISVEYNIGNGTFGRLHNTSDIGARTTTSTAVTDNYIYLASDDGSVRVYEINDSNKGHPEPIPVDNTTALNGTIKASPVVTTNTGLRYTERVYITLNNATGGCYWYNFDTRHAQFSGTEGFWVPTGSGYTMQGIAVADNWLTFGNDNKKVFAATGF